MPNGLSLSLSGQMCKDFLSAITNLTLDYVAKCAGMYPCVNNVSSRISKISSFFIIILWAKNMMSVQFIEFLN
jgi:hypothetical protein